jgi:hypothetical protein
MTPDGAKQTLVVATLLWAVAGLGQGALAPVTNPNLTSSPAAVYSPDPSHLWNRLFATFYHQQVFQGKRGGLRTIAAGEESVVGYESGQCWARRSRQA